jgi:hypothetical protein
MGEGREPLYTTLMQHVSAKVQKTIIRKTGVPNTSYDTNYVQSFFLSAYRAESSTLHFS